MTTGLFFGLATVDIFNVVTQHPSPNQKVRAERQSVSAGGPATNAAVAYASFGNEARLCCGLGSHPVANLAASDLHEHGVTLIDAAKNHDEVPVLSTIIVDSSNGNRCVVYADPNSKQLHSDIRYDILLHDIQVVLFDGFYLEQALIVARKSNEKNITTVLDGGSWKDGLEELLPFIDHVVCSDDFLPPGCKTPNEIFDYLTTKGVAHCAISRGANPITAEIDESRIDIPVPTVDAVDTLGAGDILHGAFCHYITDYPFTESLQRAAHIASQSCRYYGTREWINHL